MEPEIVLGTAQFGSAYGISSNGSALTTAQVKAIIAKANANGVNTFDTAPAYGDAELLLGRFCNLKSKFISKIPKLSPIPSVVHSEIIEGICNTMNNLQRDKLDTVLFHDPVSLMERPKVHEMALRSMIELRDSGLVNQFGASFYSPSEVLNFAGLESLDVVQVPINVLDKRWEEEGFFDRLKKIGVKVHARSIFLQGLLLMNPVNYPSWLGRCARPLEEFRLRCGEHGLTPLEAALGFVLDHDSIDKCVVGVNSVDELEQIVELSRSKLTLPNHDFQTLDVMLLDPRKWPTIQ